jgi:hypothetical protein
MIAADSVDRHPSRPAFFDDRGFVSTLTSMSLDGNLACAGFYIDPDHIQISFPPLILRLPGSCLDLKTRNLNILVRLIFGFAILVVASLMAIGCASFRLCRNNTHCFSWVPKSSSIS